MILWNDEFSLKERSESFNNQFLQALKDETLESFRTDFEKSIEPSVLSTYGDLAFRLKKADISIHEYYALKRQLIDLKEKHPELLMINDFNYLYNARYRTFGPRETSPNTFVLDDKLLNPFVDVDGTIYGYKKNQSGMSNDYARLYCCDGESGYALWSVDIKLDDKKIPPTYTISNDYLYILTGDDEFYKINKKSGGMITQIKSSAPKPVEYFDITSNGTMMVVQRDNTEENNELETAILSGTNLETLNCLFKTEIPYYAYFPDLKVMGNYFSVPEFKDSKIAFYNTQGKKSTIAYNLTVEEDDFQPSWTIEADHIFFDQKQQDDAYKLISYDLATNQQNWSFPLKSSLKLNPIVSLRKDALFLINDEKLMALSLSTQNPGQIIWENAQVKSDIWSGEGNVDCLQISGDGKYIYGLDKHRGTFIRIDVLTGANESLDKIDVGRSNKLVGTAPSGKIYVMPYFY